jgi:hypothetical protein
MEINRHISRRRMLKGMGAAIALPFLEAMLPSGLRAASLSPTPRRAAFLYMPNGIHPDRWTPEGTGSQFTLSPILQPLQGLKQEILVLTELMNKNSLGTRDGHYTKIANFLTSMEVANTTGIDISAGGISVDQLMAQRTGKETVFPSLVYGMERMRPGVDSSVGLTSLYASTMSWETPTRPCSMEIDPRFAFDRLFRGFVPGKQSTDEDPWKKSVLDAVIEDARSLERNLGAADKNKLVEYMEAIRSVEQRISDREKLREFEDHITPEIRKELTTVDARIDDYVEYRAGVDVTEKARLMLDIIVLAFWSDASRIATFLFGNEVSNRNFGFLDGVTGNHHAISHHKNDPRQLEQYAIISRWHVEQYAYFLERLKSIPEGDGTLLDNSMILFGSGLRDGDRHSPRNIPLVVAGRGGGAMKTGRHLVFDQNTPLANLYVSMLNTMGVETSQFGDSTRELTEVYA